MRARMEQKYKLTQKLIPFFLGTASLLCFFTASAAQAASVSYYLDQSNNLPNGTDYLKVSIDNEGASGAINFHIQALDPLTGLACDNSGILKFGFNSAVELDKSNILGLPDGWMIKHDKKMGKFGTFENVLIGKKWESQDSLSFSIFGIDGDSISSYANSHGAGDGAFFSAYVGGIKRDKHIGDDDWSENGHGEREWHGDDCRRCTKGAYFGGGQLAPVPVPGAVWLFSSGLIGLLGLARRGQAHRLQFADN
ncbi:MAG: hypothetical protein ACYDBW_01230 [Sulfuricaulis sp.]